MTKSIASPSVYVTNFIKAIINKSLGSWYSLLDHTVVSIDGKETKKRSWDERERGENMG